MPKEKELKSLRASERRQAGSPSGKTASKTAKAPDVAWRHFPQFEKILDSEQFEPALQKAEKTCKQLDQLIKSGSAQEKARAQTAMGAYGRTLELLRQLIELKDKMAKQR